MLPYGNKNHVKWYWKPYHRVLKNLSSGLALREAWFWMDLLHLQQVSVVAHTTHNRLSPDLTQPNPTKLNIFTHPVTLSNPIQPPQTIPTPHYILFTSPPKHSIYLSIHIHPYTDAYTLTRLNVNKLLTLYISIDILTFMWYNRDNGEGPFYMLNI